MNETTLGQGPLADVAVRSEGDRWTLIFMRDLRHPPTKVWTALTDPDQLARWAPFLASRDLTTTGGATLTMVDGDVRQELPATVTRSEPHNLLEYSWGTDVLRWELAVVALDPSNSAITSDGPGLVGITGTRLTLRHTVAGRDWIPKAAAGISSTAAATPAPTSNASKTTRSGRTLSNSGSRASTVDSAAISANIATTMSCPAMPGWRRRVSAKDQPRSRSVGMAHTVGSGIRAWK